MPDHLYLSLWVEGFTALAAPSAFKKLLAEFPFSKLSPTVTLRVHAIEFGEAPVLERDYPDTLAVEEIVEDAQELYHDDTAFQLEANWDLWQLKEDWELKPSRAMLEVYGPEFEAPQGENISIDLGAEDLFLPADEDAASLVPLRSNLRSVLHLVKDLEMSFAVRKKLLWTESGENFAEKLELGSHF